MRRRRARLLASGLAASMIVIGLMDPVAATPPDPARADHEPAGDTAPVTLLTGDRVYVAGPGSVTIAKAAGREDVTFITERRGDEVFVIPGDARELLADGTLDERLFNVTLLRESGYDHQRDDLPLIVSYRPGTAHATRAAVNTQAVRIAGSLPAVDALAVEVDKAGLTDFWRDVVASGSITAVNLDGLRQPALADSVPQVGAPAAWDAGLDGAGVTVAVLDTGVDTDHPDLADQVVMSRNFTDGGDTDEVGHGTHVASTIAGTGAASGGQNQGVAPGAQLLAGKVCVPSGCPESAILAGMQWAAEAGAAVVNLSLGGPDQPGIDPLEAAINRLTDEYGTLFVAASGNTGADAAAESPGTADAALAVGAVDKSDALTWFSSRGPRVDGALKPELAAPGAGIVAAIPGGGYEASDGTSMATPHVSGAAAILAQQHPDWSAAQLKAALMGSAQPLADTIVSGQGAGRLDVAAAIDQDVFAAPAGVSFSRQTWPHRDRQTETVSYRNEGTEDAELTLTLDTIGPDGQPAPAGLFSIPTTTVTVPAGGTAAVALTVDPSELDLTGYFGGHLIATDPAGARVVTPFGVDLEVESYDVTLIHTDRNGEPTSDYRTTLVGPLNGQDTTRVTGASPAFTVRMPAGEYFLYSWVVMTDEDGTEQWTALVYPRLEVDGDQSVELDARLAKPFRVTTQGRDSTLVYVSAYAQFFTGQWTYAVNTTAVEEDGIYTAQIGPDEPEAYLTTGIRGAWGVPGADGRVESGSELYHLADFIDGRFPTGYQRELTRAELATVRADYGVQVPDSRVLKANAGIRPEPFVGASTPFLPLDAPAVRKEYFTTGESVEWHPSVIEEVPHGESADPIVLHQGAPVSYAAGRPYQQEWNYGPFGPGLTTAHAGVVREDDWLSITADLHSDRAGHPSAIPGSGRITVERNGEPFAQRLWLPGLTSLVPVPPERSDYRVEVTGQRFSPSPFAPEVTLAWTFASGQVDGALRLPTPVVRFSPPVDATNTALAGRPVVMPVRVEAPGDSVPPLADLSVEVSYDDGESWQEARLLGAGERAVITHPAGEGYVSLRATATDQDGNSVEQTVLRAYRYAGR